MQGDSFLSKEATLYVFSLPRSSPYLNPSPFCIKLMAFYKITKLPHTVKFNTQAIYKNPNKKMPFIDVDGEIYSDSRLILEKYKSVGLDLDSDLTPINKAISLAFRRMLEEHTLWYGLMSRWGRNYDFTVKLMFPNLPWFLFWLPLYVYRSMMKNLYAQGMGRLNYTEQWQITKQDIDAVESLLKESKTDFFFNSKTPTNLDIVAFSFMFSFTSMPINDQATPYIMNNCDRIKSLVARMLKDYFPDESIHFANLYANKS